MTAHALECALIELVWFVLMWLCQRWVAQRAAGMRMDLMDQGPWWSVWFHRLWLVAHLPALVLHLGLGAVGKTLRLHRPLGLSQLAFHVANGLVLVAVSG